jgi:hypothetical protein
LASHAVLVIVYYVPDDEPLSSKHVEAEWYTKIKVIW